MVAIQHPQMAHPSEPPVPFNPFKALGLSVSPKVEKVVRECMSLPGFPQIPPAVFEKENVGAFKDDVQRNAAVARYEFRNWPDLDELSDRCKCIILDNVSSMEENREAVKALGSLLRTARIA